MAKIKDGNPGREDGAYYRIFGDKELGALISRIHATSIRAGTELEKMISQRVELIDDLDKFLKKDEMPDGVWIAPKREIKRCEQIKFAEAEPDFLVFKRKDGHQHCHVIELKDGDAFDTKKATGEWTSMRNFISHIADKIPYRVNAHFCCFNQADKDVIVTGFKGRITLQEAMTGEEFCELLEINYEEIINARKKDQQDNMEFFLTGIIEIQEKQIRKILANRS